MSKANKSVNNKAPIRKLKQEKPRDNKPLIIAGAGFCGALFALLCYGAFTLYQDAYDNNQQLDLLNRQAQELAASLNEESEMNQKLNAELESKNESLEHLNQRLDDMETVLGLQTDGENPYTLEQRIDSAAIDSAVRATLFRLIPNGMPTPSIFSSPQALVLVFTRLRKNVAVIMDLISQPKLAHRFMPLPMRL